MAEREKGVESVHCPNCDKKLALSDQPDGSLAAANCNSCYPKATQAEVKEQNAELASADSTPRERGTVTDKES